MTSRSTPVLHWVDIVPPHPPATADGHLALTAGALALAVLATLFAWRYHRPPRDAIRALRKLAREVRDSRIGVRPAGAEIDAQLRAALRRERLRTLTWPAERQSHWLHYLDALDRCRFAGEAPAKEELEQLIGEALLWVNNAHRNGHATGHD